MDGDLGDYGGDHSSADSALCCLIAFYAGRNESLIDQVFRRSKLMHRSEWDDRHGGDGATYGEITIRNSLSVVTEFYSWEPPPCVTNMGERVDVDENGDERRGPYSVVHARDSRSNARADSRLAATSSDGAIYEQKALNWIANVDDLFGFLHSQVGQVTWQEGPSPVRRKKNSFAAKHTATQYEAVEEFPHFPQFASHYYLSGDIQSGNGPLL